MILGLAFIVGGMILTLSLQPLRGLEGWNDLFSLFGFIGLILLIVGAVKSDRPSAGQQQQQQVVVFTPQGAPYSANPPAPAAPAPQLRCPTCQGLNEGDARFCQTCGHQIPSRATGSGPAPRRSRGKK